MSRPHLPVWLRGIFLILSLVVIGLLLKQTGVAHVFERDWIDSHIRSQAGGAGELIFLGLGILVTATGLPRQMVAFLGGYAFGVWLGTVLAALAALGGCLLTFFYARIFGRHLIRKLFPNKIEAFDQFVQGHPFSMTVLVRLLPVGSNLVTNLVAGVSRIPRPAFFAGSLIGYLPQTLIFALAGSGLTMDSRGQLIASILLFVISGLIGVHLYRRMRHGRSIATELETPTDPA